MISAPYSKLFKELKNGTEILVGQAFFNPRPTKPFFVTWFTKGLVTTPPHELEIDGPKV